MQNKPLKVKPARRVYQPRYPSYADKNPLLHPETRPYPFQLKFVKWLSAGGLASIMLLNGSELMAQSAVDTLYNPFPFEQEKAKVPFMSGGFGTGMPERLTAEEARTAIKKAFTDSGIALEEQFRLKEKDIDVRLDGYNAEEKIGFILMTHDNKDNSYHQGSGKLNFGKKKDLSSSIKHYHKKWEEVFSGFVRDKKGFLEKLARRNQTDHIKTYLQQLESLEPKTKNTSLFIEYHLQYELGNFSVFIKEEEPLIKEMYEYIDRRFKPSIEKRILWGIALNFRSSTKVPDKNINKFSEEFRKLSETKSDKDFIKDYLIMNDFLSYYSGAWSLRLDETYQKLKLEVMNTWPLEKWCERTEKLDAYQDERFLSLEEAQLLDSNNAKGFKFVAPIDADDARLIKSRFKVDTQELEDERRLLRMDYREQNGMTEKILLQQRIEQEAISEKYKSIELHKLPKQERDSLQNKRSKENEMIRNKYKAMEQLTPEKKEEFGKKIRALNNRIHEKQENEIRQNAMKRLEDEVKLYIKWAKSQMGG